MFSVFALNNTLVQVIMYFIEDRVIQLQIGLLGFAVLMVVVLFILMSCLLIGFLREKIWRKVDESLEDIVSCLVKKVRAFF